jgi:hypothetical protein
MAILLITIPALFLWNRFSAQDPGPNLTVNWTVLDLGKSPSIPFRLISVLGDHFGDENTIFLQPRIAVGKGGGVYVSDLRNDRVLHFDDIGRLINKVGKAGQRKGEFLFPYCITTGNDNQIYVLETLNKRIECFDQNLGLVRTIYPEDFYGGNFVVNREGLVYMKATDSKRLAIGVDTLGQSRVIIYKTSDITRYESEGHRFTFEIALDRNDNIYSAYLFADGIYLDKYLEGTSQVFRTKLLYPIFPSERPANTSQAILAYGQDQNLYLLLVPLNAIYRFDSSGTLSGQIKFRAEDVNDKTTFVAIAVDAASNVYLADRLTDKLFKFSPEPDS